MLQLIQNSNLYDIIKLKTLEESKTMIGNYNCNIDIDSLEIKDVIDINQLQKFQDNFAESMDITSITVDKNGNPVTY